MRRTVVVLAMAGLMLGSRPVGEARAQGPAGSLAVTREEPGPGEALGLGMGAIGTNLLYMPAKMLYALGGGFVGLLAWGVTAGNDDVALGILQPALSGTWVVTPEMLRGDQPILFLGPSYEPKSQR